MRTALLYVCIALTLGCAAHSDESVAEWRDAAVRWRDALYQLHRTLHTSAGFSFWDCNYDRPVYFIRGEYLDTAWVKKHEERHIQQMNAVSSCAVWQVLSDDSLFRARMEEDAARYSRRP